MVSIKYFDNIISDSCGISCGARLSSTTMIVSLTNIRDYAAQRREIKWWTHIHRSNTKMPSRRAFEKRPQQCVALHLVQLYNWNTHSRMRTHLSHHYCENTGNTGCDHAHTIIAERTSSLCGMLICVSREHTHMKLHWWPSQSNRHTFTDIDMRRWGRFH